MGISNERFICGETIAQMIFFVCAMRIRHLYDTVYQRAEHDHCSL